MSSIYVIENANSLCLFWPAVYHSVWSWCLGSNLTMVGQFLSPNCLEFYSERWKAPCRNRYWIFVDKIIMK